MTRTYHVRWNVPRIITLSEEMSEAPFDAWAMWNIPDTHPLKPNSTTLMALIVAEEAAGAEAALLAAYEEARFRLILYLDTEADPDIVSETRTKIENIALAYKAAVVGD